MGRWGLAWFLKNSCYTLYNTSHLLKEFIMLAIRIEKPLIKALDLLAKEKHTNRSVIIRNAIIHYLEDIEDLGLAKLAQKKMKTTKSLLQIRKELGLDS